MKDFVIQLKNLSRTYQKGPIKVKALEDFSLEITRGEFVSIMGSSGSGKSTLLHLLGCLDRPTSGQYFLDGEEVSLLNDKDLSKIRCKRIGFVFQSFNLLSLDNVLQNVELPMIYDGCTKRKRRERSKEIIEQVGLSERIHHLPGEMSGGQNQRVAIARALVNDPAIILADEPTGNLDSKTGVEIMDLFKKINQSGKTIIIVTHEKEIAKYTNRIITVKDGYLESDERT